MDGQLQIYPPQNDMVSEFWREKYEKDARKYWDIFYKRNMDKFFKDRHYLEKEWGHYFREPVCLSGDDQLGCSKSIQPADPSCQSKVVLEMGCGVGNTLFPLMSVFPNLIMYACDFSPRAINLVKAHKDYEKGKIHAFVSDLTSQELASEIPPASVDLVLSVFTLSAVSPEKMPHVLRNIKRVLKPNGYVLLRDYAAGDLAQERLSLKGKMISNNFYVRGDGTRVFYFTELMLKDIFSKEGFACEEIKIYNKRVENRLRKIVMNRCWIQAAFKLVEEPDSDVNNSSPLLSFSSDPAFNKDPRFAEALSCKENYGTIIGKESDTSVLLDTSSKFSSACLLDDEVDLSDFTASEMFGCPQFEVMHVEVSNYAFKIKCLPKENQHTHMATGFMIWECALAFANLLVKNPLVLARKRVLELGSGSAGICSIVASKFADVVVASDGDPGVVDLLQENIEANKDFIGPGKLFTEVLEWGKKEGIQSLINKVGGEGFDLIIGTDVTYAKEVLPLLFTSARALLKGFSHCPLLLLCHITRHANEASIISVAKKDGFYLKDKWPNEGNECNLSSIFTQGLDCVLLNCSPIRILCFHLEE